MKMAQSNSPSKRCVTDERSIRNIERIVGSLWLPLLHNDPNGKENQIKFPTT